VITLVDNARDLRAEKIRLGRPKAIDEQVRRAAGQALADEFIPALSESFDTIVGERASRLSCGQCQRISLAHAALKDSPILVMDEPVSSLEAEDELKKWIPASELASGLSWSWGRSPR